MTLARRFAALAMTLLLVACDAGPGPTTPSGNVPTDPGAPTSATRSEGPPDNGQDLAAQLGGPWRRSPILLDDARIAIISDACAGAARETFGETEANLPTAVVDARGEHLAIAILADDLDAIECIAHLDDTGTAASVDGINRLSMTAVAPVAGAKISVASVVYDFDPASPRTYAFGRIGPVPEGAKVGFDDGSVVLATDAEGWWAMWWKGHARANSYSAVDKADIVVGSATAFDGEREAAVGPGTWWLDPAAPPPTAASTTIRAIVNEQTCASGHTPEGRIEPPLIDLSATAVTISFEIRLRPGSQDCQGVPPFPIAISLPEPLGGRILLDGSTSPPRDASKPPVN